MELAKVSQRDLKIGILTFHEVFNPGAFLQAYATQELLRKWGYDPVIIDYNPKRHRYHPVMHGLRMHFRFPLKWRHWMDCISLDRAYEAARNEYLNLSEHFTTRSEVGQVHFDAVIVGADIVWNYELKRLGRDPVYFGEGLDTQRLIAFAASCGACSPNGAIPDYVSRNLPQFDSIAVRDSNSAKIVERVSGEAPLVICDPTFHLKPWARSRASCASESKEDRIVVYLLHDMASGRLVEQIKKFSKAVGLPIHAIVYGYDWADENLMTQGPFEWMDTIRSARYVITNTFHGTIFSVLTEANFVVELNEAIRSKTEALIQDAGLEPRLYGSNSSLSEMFDHELDLTVADAYIDAQVEISSNYLKRSLCEI